MVVSVLLTVGCGSPVSPPPVVEGTIVETASEPHMILVEGQPTACGYWFVVDTDTELVVTTPSGSTTTADRAALHIGASVRVWAAGDMVLTCPAKGRADRIVVER